MVASAVTRRVRKAHDCFHVDDQACVIPPITCGLRPASLSLPPRRAGKDRWAAMGGKSPRDV
ncbi:hypothetical protein E2C01_024980 [Portunus trituberculatus]|uniref:Uncharacterized protein n=1 Tax=Portunus trituberculatus TaxID=210409 RepID=A0A5B7EGM4_PORTR|nr:hypothetical protein [Portunus trituberculatus]